MTPKQFFAQHSVFTAAEFAAALKERTAASHDSILAYHHRAGHLTRLRRGLYATVPPGSDPAHAVVEPFTLAAKLAPDSVLAYYAALSFHCNVLPGHRHFHYLTATAPREFCFGGNVFRPVHSPKALRVRGQGLWGVQDAERNGIGFRVTSVERTLVDVLDRLDLGNGLGESWRSVESMELLDLERVIEYAILLHSATAAAKVGFFLSQHRLRLMVKESHLATLREHLPRSPHYIQPGRRAGDGAMMLVRDWNIIVPKRFAYSAVPAAADSNHGSVIVSDPLAFVVGTPPVAIAAKSATKGMKFPVCRSSVADPVQRSDVAFKPMKTNRQVRQFPVVFHP